MSLVHFGDARLPARFWDKVSPEPTSGCWVWTASLNAYGYGQYSHNKHPVRSHRLAYLTLIGPVPTGLELDHKCRVRCCVNPEHLEPVTSAENSRRGDAGKATGAQKTARTHCPHGHEFAGDNLIVSDKQRFCRECRRKASRDYQRRKNAGALQLRTT